MVFDAQLLFAPRDCFISVFQFERHAAAYVRAAVIGHLYADVQRLRGGIGITVHKRQRQRVGEERMEALRRAELLLGF